ncbi:MAG: V-type ATP synthase subunit F [Treponema sp.]|jgi:V/A-type H+-transporting ATPase subunit F|nr:V-type ATP synthase subunit F [Treponema sp.]
MDFFFIGDSELVTAFRFIGIEGVSVKDSAEAVEVFRGITEGWNETAGALLPRDLGGAGDCRVLIMTEETADWLGDVLIQWQLSANYPLVVEIPGIMGSLPGRKTLVDSIREAIGVHV